ncbi:hypothetical protein GUITHDRAFT_106806 [Guillardia theta CCMP2712]|uniref:Uncharacterized protein n=1 Tax=Guillardia theta (strain CCMP2712) TaxID=905079 RepID=L1JGU8_GUITC|nr:hypothetical protein GUITHDRAFT_106806 [Guillardia theta CCMP2712]EKX47359.1 hypothetical protein GUITHDRAFT_106806 [Guillardia theta CCMP2712]|eukprot:XP_005834339.1 hypothetical protein GUITHDRAFT_106806 [Guillardia theta CCMP2712]
MSAEIDRLRHALASMYTCADAAERNSADKFLQVEFLYSQECWDLSIALLKLPTATSYEHLFCARALHVRLRCSVSKAERKQVQFLSILFVLTSSLPYTTARWSHEPSGRTILTQICSAVAVLVCKMESWETKMVVKDLALSFAAANMAMLETIRVLPVSLVI